MPELLTWISAFPRVDHVDPNLEAQMLDLLLAFLQGGLTIASLKRH
jgi:hypothetical protein